MDERPEQQTGAQPEEPRAFSINMGGDQPPQVQPQPSTPSPYAPPPLTPAPQTFTAPPSQSAPMYPGAPQATPPTPEPTMSSLVVLSPPVKKERGALGRPFPLPLSLLIALGSVVLLAAVFGARVLLGGDWAEGAAAASVVALSLAAVTFLTALLRVAAGRRSLGFALLTFLLLVVLVGSGVAGLASGGALHLAQAKSLEQSGQWGPAIREYGLAGQKGPNAPDIARLQNAWGEQLLQQHNYSTALGHFQTVLDDYQDSGSQVARAQKNQFLAYAAWMKSDSTHVTYQDAIAVFANYASDPGCDSTCQATLAEVAPQAYYLYGMQLLQQKRFKLAITEFGKIGTQYGSSAFAKQAHSQSAVAYLAYGKQLIDNRNCTEAVTSYKTLVASYKDTPEAATAQAALNAPQDVTGIFDSPPTNPLPTVQLSRHINVGAFYFSSEYTTSVDAKTGAFTVKSVAQGTYYLTASRPVSGGIDYYWWTDNTTGQYYSFTVTPLCPMSLGTFQFSK